MDNMDNITNSDNDDELVRIPENDSEDERSEAVSIKQPQSKIRKSLTSSVGLGLDNKILARGKTFTGAGSTQPSSVAISNGGGQKHFRKSLLSSISTNNKLGMKKGSGGGMS